MLCFNTDSNYIKDTVSADLLLLAVGIITQIQTKLNYGLSMWTGPLKQVNVCLFVHLKLYNSKHERWLIASCVYIQNACGVATEFHVNLTAET